MYKASVTVALRFRMQGTARKIGNFSFQRDSDSLCCFTELSFSPSVISLARPCPDPFNSSHPKEYADIQSASPPKEFGWYASLKLQMGSPKLLTTHKRDFTYRRCPSSKVMNMSNNIGFEH